MTLNGVELSEISYCILIKLYGKLKNIDKVEEIVTIMDQKKVQINQKILANLVDVYVENNLYERAVQILEGKEWNTYVYTSLIKGLSQKNSMKEIIILYKKMKESNKSH